MTEPSTTEKKLDELYGLIEKMHIAMLTTRRADGMLVTRPMATQKRDPMADLWFVTDVETHKIEEIEQDPHVSIGYLDHGSMEWVSVSGIATISQDREKIRELYEPDWRAWFGDEGGEKDGGPDDPRLALIKVDAQSAIYMKAKHSKPRMLFEVARGIVTGKEPDVGREERLSAEELDSESSRAA
jgi:general stress protein 26